MGAAGFCAAAQAPAAPLPGAPVSGAGPAGTPTGSSKIAVIAFQVAVGRTNEFQRSFLEIQRKWDPKQKQLKADGDAVDSEAKLLETSTTLTDEQRASRAKALDDRRKTLERSFEDARDGYQQEVQTLFNGTASKVFDVLADYAQKNGYTLVLDVASQSSPVLYAIETTDITDPVVSAYNVKSGVAPPPQPVAVPPAPGTAKPATPKVAAPKQ